MSLLRCKPVVVAHHTEEHDKDTIIGVELEIENCQHNSRWYTDRFYSFLNVTTDNSLRGETSYEFVTKPMQASVCIEKLKGFFELSQFTDEVNHPADRTSIHVHCNVLDMTEEQLATLCLVYQTVEEILFQYVGHYREGNIYCVPWSQCRMSHDMIRKLFDKSTYVTDGGYGPFYRWEKYTALNLQPILRQGTVEFRHMYGTSDVEVITKWIQLVTSIVSFAKKTPFESLIKNIKELNSSSMYEKYFHDIFNGLLEYRPHHAQALETGVINAKCSLVGFKGVPVSAPKKATTKKKAVAAPAGVMAILDDLVYQHELYQQTLGHNVTVRPANLIAGEDIRQQGIGRFGHGAGRNPVEANQPEGEF